MFYFTPLPGFFSPFPHGTISLSVIQEYLALRGGPRRFTRGFTCPMLLGIQLVVQSFRYRIFTFYDVSFQRLHLTFQSIYVVPQPYFIISSLGCSLFARRYCGNRFCFLFLWLLRCFNSPGSLLHVYVLNMQFKEFPHSGTSGSKLTSSSPKRFVGRHALHRF